jgi:uncharacterized protein (TIGR03790 family)
MSPLRRSVWVSLALSLLAFLTGTVRGDLGASDVLVVYNNASPDGLAIANYYAQTHPGVQLLGLSNVTTSEEISATAYLNTIRPQIAAALTPDIDVIVTTKGLPLRITNSVSGPTRYTDPFNVVRSVAQGSWKQYSSLESELTRIDTISTVNQMGDNNYLSSAGKPNFPNPSSNAYCQSSSSPSADFQYSTYYNSHSYNGNVYGGMRLTSRLDGYTVQDVEASIDRATHAFLLPQISKVVLDDDPNPSLVDQMATAASVLAAKNQPFIYDNTSAAVTTAPGQVVGYVSHGVHAGLPSDYISTQLHFNLGPGAVFASHESFNAYSFQQGGSTMGQGQLAQWLANGGTVGVGNVQEPSAGAAYEANEDKMFAMLADGKTWAEAAWSSIRQLSYVTTVVGDPLMTWKTLIPGDANMDGVVGFSDLNILTGNWGLCGPADGSLWTDGDFDCNGAVDFADMCIINGNWGVVADWASSVGSASAVCNPLSVPEPSTICLAYVGSILSFVAYRRRHRQSAR